jgi:magnesium transporter
MSVLPKALQVSVVDLLRPRRSTVGEAPGQVEAGAGALAPQYHVIGYGPDELHEYQPENIDEVVALKGKHPVIWVNVDGLGDVDAVRRLGETFGLHLLALEDAVKPPQRAKAEDYSDHFFFLGHMMSLAGESGAEAEIEQLSIFFGRDFVLTLQQHPGDCLDGVRRRLREGRPRIRNGGGDYLAYAIIDASIDSALPVIEQLSDHIVDIEDGILSRTDRGAADEIRNIKRRTYFWLRTALPMRDAVVRLQRDDTGVVTEETKLFLRDCFDHAVQTNELLQDARQSASDLMEMHQTALSNKLNDIMKLLTMFAAIFIPLSFIAGLYGMNFDPSVSPWNMPELGWVFGYPFALGLMVTVATGLLIYFRVRGWLGNNG